MGEEGEDVLFLVLRVFHIALCSLLLPALLALSLCGSYLSPLSVSRSLSLFPCQVLYVMVGAFFLNKRFFELRKMILYVFLILCIRTCM